MSRQEKVCIERGMNKGVLQHRNIKFTVEHERENKIAFPDVQVTRTNNRLTTSVYHKPTHTDRYIPFHSHHHQRTVTGVLRCMRDRANKICDPTSKQKVFQHLQAVFQANGFPAELVKKTLSHQTHLTHLNLCMRIQQNHRRSCAYPTSEASVKE